MHQITMAVPQFFQSGSHPDEKKAIQLALNRCVSTLITLHSGCRLDKGSDGTVIFTLPHVFHKDSDLNQNAAALEPLLECLTDIDFIYEFYHPGTQPLYENDCYYDRTVVWDSTPALYKRGYGDCKSLSCKKVAEFRAAGLPARPVFRFLPPDQNPKGQFQYHILVLGPNGPRDWLDPSKVKGMGKNENAYFNAAR